MAIDDMEIASALRERLAQRVGCQRYELWFGERTRLCLNDTALVVAVSSSFLQDWLRTHFRCELEESCHEVLGRRVPIQFEVDPTLAATSHDACNDSAAPSQQPASRPQLSKPRATAPSRPVEKRGGLSGTGRGMRAAGKRTAAGSNGSGNGHACRADLASFVVGQHNRLAFTSAQMIVERPGTVSPLVLYGETGVGKTHLLEGILTEMRRVHPRIHGVYLTAEQFTTCFLEALNGRGLPSFRQKYRHVDVLLLDGVQFLAGKRATLVELLYTVDALLKEGHQLVFASDRAPAELKALGPELVARLGGGLVCQMEPADYATRLGIVRNLCQKFDVDMADTVQSLVASHITNCARELAGAIHRLKITSMAEEQPITRDLAERVVTELLDQSCAPVQLGDIRRAVCDVFGIPPESLQSPSKVASVSHPRMLAMWLARKHTRAALSEIGQFFGRRSHSTVISAQKKVQRWMTQQTRLTLSSRTCDVEEAIRRVEQSLRRA
ncbi:MAG: DnaA ATPase domain-containing protein [Pirellulales bacterium]